MKKAGTLMAMCLAGALSLSSFTNVKTTEKASWCQATYTVVVTDGNGNVLDQATMHGYGNSCAEAMADAKYRMAPVKEYMLRDY